MLYKPQRLTEPELEHLRGEEVSKQSYRERPDKLEEQVEEKRNLLPERFENLFRDIDLFWRTGHLNPQVWTDGWMELVGVSDRSDLPEALSFSSNPEGYAAASSDPSDTSPISSSQPANFGEKIGMMVRQLMINPTDKEDDQVLADLIWGFMYGLTFKDPPGQTDGYYPVSSREREIGLEDLIARREDRIEDILDRVDERAKTRTTQDLRYRWNRQDRTQSGWQDLQEANERIRSILRDHDIEPTHYIVWYLSINLVQVHIDRDQGLDERTAAEEYVTDETVMRMVHQQRLREKQTLQNQAEQDLDIDPNIPKPENRGKSSILGRSSPAGIPVMDVLANVPLDASVSTKRLSRGVGNITPVAKIGLYLAKDKPLDGEELPGPPLIETDTDPTDYLTADWRLSPYGKFIKCYIDNEYGLMGHPTEIPKEIIDSAVTYLESYKVDSS